MAERIESLPEGRTGSRAVSEEWLDGSAWKLVKGEDFERSVSAMRAALSVAGRARGLRLRSRTMTEGDNEALAVQFVPRDDAPADKVTGKTEKQTASSRAGGSK